MSEKERRIIGMLQSNEHSFLLLCTDEKMSKLAQGHLLGIESRVEAIIKYYFIHFRLLAYV